MLGICLSGYSQIKAKRVKMNPALYKQSIVVKNNTINNAVSSNAIAPYSKAITEDQIGVTFYDLQTNSSTDSRIRLYPDGTIGATWTRGMDATAFADRGTGYNYFDGTAWGAMPTARIEDYKTGWPSYAALGNGEIIVAHGSAAGLTFIHRETKGTGTWTMDTIPFSCAIYWPRVCVEGNNIHVLAHTNTTSYGGLVQAVVYLRSTDGGETWDSQIIPGLDTAALGVVKLSGDIYAWAEPKNGTLAFVIGDKWMDLLLFKSTDNGTTWTETKIYDHPADFVWDTDIPMDTTYVCDGGTAVDLDNSGNAHVLFGVTRILVEDPTTDQYSFFPLAEGLIYWNETMPTYTQPDIDPSDSTNADKFVGWILDIDESGVIMDNFADIAELPNYRTGATSMPQITLDENERIFITYSSINETQYGGSISYTQFFRNVFLRHYKDGVWSDFYNLTDPVANPLYEGMECIYPTMAKQVDNSVHLFIQRDDEPGLHISGSTTEVDSPTENAIVYIKIPKEDIGITSVETQFIDGNINLYPNPASKNANLSIISEKAQVATVIITNILGEQSENNYNLNAGNNLINLNLNELSAGLYLVNVKYGKNIYSTKLVVE